MLCCRDLVDKVVAQGDGTDFTNPATWGSPSTHDPVQQLQSMYLSFGAWIQQLNRAGRGRAEPTRFRHLDGCTVDIPLGGGVWEEHPVFILPFLGAEAFAHIMNWPGTGFVARPFGGKAISLQDYVEFPLDFAPVFADGFCWGYQSARWKVIQMLLRDRKGPNPNDFMFPSATTAEFELLKPRDEYTDLEYGEMTAAFGNAAAPLANRDCRYLHTIAIGKLTSKQCARNAIGPAKGIQDQEQHCLNDHGVEHFAIPLAMQVSLSTITVAVQRWFA